MKCCAEGCERDAHYKAAQLCQMHYFRQRRYGTTETVRRGKAKPRQETPQGYQWVYEPTHPLRHRNSGYVAEHRAVLYADLGDRPLSCELCGISLTWATCHVDHIDADVRNNTRANLRPTCCTCNTRRGMRPPAQWNRTISVEYEGVALTPHEWSRDPRVEVSGSTIRARIKAGMTAEQALFGPKVTHNGRKPKPYEPKTHAKHERSNSVAITCNGKTLTAAEWVREPGVTVSRAGLIWRLRQGWEPSRALFQQGRFA